MELFALTYCGCSFTNSEHPDQYSDISQVMDTLTLDSIPEGRNGGMIFVHSDSET